MKKDVELSCRCGKIHGLARGISPNTVNRVLCYCDDCQAYLHYLERADLFELHSGTEVVQVAPQMVSFEKGTQNIVALRLTPKGMYRWYASCCKTPLGNTVLPSFPFIGMPLEVFCVANDARSRTELFGPIRGASFGRFATEGIPEGSTKVNFSLLFRAVRLMSGWKLSGKTWPHPFFDQASKTTKYPVYTLSSDEREALRPKCGPNPTVVVASATKS